MTTQIYKKYTKPCIREASSFRFTDLLYYIPDEFRKDNKDNEKSKDTPHTNQ